jgi:SAM-dependent methyltransferase
MTADQRPGAKIPLEKAWSNYEVFQYYDKGRKSFRPATSHIVRSVFQKYVPPHGSIIEIGSGLGELGFNLLSQNSPFRSNLQMTEQSAQLIARHKELHPDSNVRQANVYALPFSDNSRDTVIGFASFDTLADPKKAVAEMSKVLKPGGRIIHFLDLQADRSTFWHNWNPEADPRVPIPIKKEETNELGVILAPKKIIFDTLREDPEASLLRWSLVYGRTHLEKNFNDILDMEGTYRARSLIDSEDVDTVYFNDYFFNSMRQAFAAQGLQTDEFGMRDAYDIVDSDAEEVTTSDAEKKLQSNNVLISTSGIISGAQDSSVPDGKVKVISKVHVMVAQKPDLIAA